MKRTTWRRVTAIFLASILFIAGFVFTEPIQAFSSQVYGESIVLGNSGNDRNNLAVGSSSGNRGPDDLLFDAEALPLGISPMSADMVHYISNINELYTLLHQKTGDYNIVLTDDIYFTVNYIFIRGNVVIDGQGQYKIIQTRQASKSYEHFYLEKANSSIVFKDVDIVTKTTMGIVRAPVKSNVITFENVHLTGPMAVYCNGVTGVTVNIINSTFIHNDAEDDDEDEDITGGDGNDGTSATDRSMFYRPTYVVFDGGTSIINSNPTKVKYTTSAILLKSGYKSTITVMPDTNVKINSNGMLFHTYSSNYDIFVEEGANLDLKGAAFQYGDHGFDNIIVNENARFSYKQKGTTTKGSLNAYVGVNNLEVKPGATFIVQIEGGNKSSSDMGLRVRKTAVIDAPKYVSVYGGRYAFHSSTSNSSNAGNWTIKNADYVHYWTASNENSVIAHPRNDAEEDFSPQYTWSLRQMGETEGPTFNFAGTRKAGVTSTTPGNLYTIIQPGQPVVMSGTMKLDKTVQRMVIGTPEDPDDEEEDEVLELLSVPSHLYFGTHELPAVSTIYPRKYYLIDDDDDEEEGDDGDLNADMIVRVRDTRGEGAAPWTLTVELAETFSTENSEHEIADGLVFISDGDKVPLSAAPLPIHTASADTNRGVHTLIWGENEGLLAEVKPGAAEEGEYTAVLKWSLQVTP